MVQFSVFGRIVSIGTALLRDGPDRDSLVIGCQDAKVSIIQYDPEISDMQTVSLHCFEDELLKGGFTRDFPPPIVRVDHENRCLAMLVYGHHIGVVPLFKEFTFDDDAAARSGSLVSPYHIPLTSYTFALDSFEDKIRNVRDMCFLSGYYEPTLLILHEPTQTTSGRVAMRMDTCCICAISLNVKERIHAIVWSVSSLPLDCWRLQAIPKPISGVLVFGVDEIIHLNQSVPPFGVSVNSNLNSSTHFPLHNREELMLALDQCTSDFLSPKQLAISLNNGDLYVLTLIVDNLNCVKNFHFDQAAHSVITSAIVHCERGLIFLASRMGNSLLLK